VDSVNAGATVQFENPPPRLENAIEFMPNNIPLCPTDQSVRKNLVICLGNLIPVGFTGSS
jgi:hypothetical protein